MRMCWGRRTRTGIKAGLQAAEGRVRDISLLSKGFHLENAAELPTEQGMRVCGLTKALSLVHSQGLHRGVTNSW